MAINSGSIFSVIWTVSLATADVQADVTAGLALWSVTPCTRVALHISDDEGITGEEHENTAAVRKRTSLDVLHGDDFCE